MKTPSKKIMAVPVVLWLLSQAVIAQTSCIYTQDFSSDPGWTTDDPAKLGWDAATGTFHGIQVNTEGTYAYIDLPTFNPNKAWRLEWDHRINSDQWSAGLTIGLLDGRLQYPYGAGMDMSISDSGYGTGIWGASSAVPSTFSPSWSAGVWYHSVMQYDPVSHQLTLCITNRSSGVAFLNLSMVVSSFPSDTTRFGVSRVNVKNNAPGVNPTATVDYNLDNVRLYREAAPLLASGMVNTTVSPGGTAQLTVKVLGSQVLRYQWFFNGNLLSATGSSLAVTNATQSQAGTYCVIVSNPFGAITNCAYLSVLDLKMFAGVVLAGPTNTSYRIDYLNALGGTNTWQPLTTFTLTSSPMAWIDMDSPYQPQRFYRAVPLP